VQKISPPQQILYQESPKALQPVTPEALETFLLYYNNKLGTTIRRQRREGNNINKGRHRLAILQIKPHKPHDFISRIAKMTFENLDILFPETPYVS